MFILSAGHRLWEPESNRGHGKHSLNDVLQTQTVSWIAYVSFWVLLRDEVNGGVNMGLPIVVSLCPENSFHFLRALPSPVGNYFGFCLEARR